MAIIDDQEWLLKHVRHAFITSDDTGMCEMVIQDNDLLSLADHRKQLREETHHDSENCNNNDPQSKKELKKFRSVSKPSSPSSDSLEDDVPQKPLAPSPDILSGWDFGVRRRSNTAQKLERIRRERQNRVKVKTVRWGQMSEQYNKEHKGKLFDKRSKAFALSPSQLENGVGDSTHLPSGNGLFTSLNRKHGIKSTAEPSAVRTELVSSTAGFDISADASQILVVPEVIPVESRNGVSNQKEEKLISLLTEQLQNSVQITENPFKDYARFNGHSSSSSSQRIHMFVYVYGQPAPTQPVNITMLVHGAKVLDLVGLTCWQYGNEQRSPPLQHTTVNGYSVQICEDDGEVDHEFPPLDSYEPMAKFSFPALALLEKRPSSSADDAEDEIFRKSIFVKVNDVSGFSLIQVKDLSVTMGEILAKAVRKRKGRNYIGTYRLEYQDRVGVVVDPAQTLDSTAAMEFCLLREHSSRSLQNQPSEEAVARYNNISSTTHSNTDIIKPPGITFNI